MKFSFDLATDLNDETCLELLQALAVDLVKDIEEHGEDVETPREDIEQSCCVSDAKPPEPSRLRLDIDGKAFDIQYSLTELRKLIKSID